MNARERLEVMIRTDRGSMTVWSQPEIRDALDAYRAEILAEDGQAYDGELEMFRFLVRTLRLVARGDAGFAEMRRLLWHHATDEAAQQELSWEKNSREAEPTPDFFQPNHVYKHSAWTFRCAAVTTYPGTTDPAAIGWFRFLNGEWTLYTASQAEWDDGWTDLSSDTARQAALRDAIRKDPSGRWKSGRAVKVLRDLGHHPLSPSTAARCLAALAAAGHLTRFESEGVRWYEVARRRPLPTTKHTGNS